MPPGISELRQDAAGANLSRMAVRVRLTRVGSKKNAQWRVVVADQRSPRDGRFIEMIGHYNPQTEPSQIVIDRERLDHWLQRGAEPSGTVRKLMRAENSNSGAATAVAEPDVAAPAGEAEAPAAEPVADAEALSDSTSEAEPTPAAEAPAPAEESGGDAAAAGGGSG